MDNLMDFAKSGIVTACLVGAVAIGSVQAATNPLTPTGTSSTGDLDVFVTVPDLVWIQNLDDIAMLYVPNVDAVGSDAFCVYATTATYDITITSSNGGGGFVFTATGQAAPLQTVTYGVKFDDDLTPNDGADVQEGVTIPGVTNPVGGVPPACAVGSNNASIEVTFPAGGNLASALVDTYEDTLTMLIEPV